MPRPFLGLVLVVSLAAVAAPAAQQTAVFRVGADNVPLFVTVRDKSGRLVPNLTRDDFQVFDSGKLQPLTNFDNSPQPIALTTLIDVSGSMSGNLPILRAACEELIRQLAPVDQARIGTFGKDVTIPKTFTRDQTALLAALPTFIPPDAPTPLWSAMIDGIGSFGDALGRRVVMTLSDGKDEPGPRLHGTWLTPLDVIDRAQHEDVTVYGIGLRSRSAGPMAMGGNLMQQLGSDEPDPGLGKVAEDSGGGYLELFPRDDLGATFARVLDELHHQYLLGFVPQKRDGKAHKVEVKLTKGGMEARTRKTYVAPK